MRHKNSSIDTIIDEAILRMRDLVYTNIDSDLISDISEICCREISQTIKSLAKTINANL